ncbi:deleted in malignant brain tumors 1 protein-like isoform X1 [Mytilus californianus]|uniref:deleted in malignant brain tumors 1 protein-like isoform X1 n=1 Tax=Mytilus californianus TaxID=6549 RepID=UPI0022476568|nr:deleted in malignant brain tumors 1 protein-like isoform X1 [Mytilus californianus]
MFKHNGLNKIFHLILIYGAFSQVKGQTTINVAGTGSSGSQGRVEITRNGVTGTVCDDRFDDLAAAVVCRQLGFQNGGVAVTDGRFGQGTGPIWLDDVTCQGNELNIEQCTARPWNQSNCQHSEDVGVICNVSPVVSPSVLPATTRGPATVQPSNCTSPSPNIRLIGLSNLNGIGFVEVQRNGVWGSICDDQWGKEDAQVVCRMLCYDPNVAQAGAPQDIYSQVVIDKVSANYLLDDVECIGTETDIEQCPKSTVHNCNVNQKEFASVTCVKLLNAQPLAPVPELECSGGKFYARFSRIQDKYLEEKHLSIFYPYTGPCNSDTQKTTDTVTIIIPYSECGTVTTVNTSHIIYTNSIKYDYTVIANQIVRVNTYRIEVSCEFPRDLDTDKGVTPLTETVTQKAPGTFTISMSFYNDSFITALNGSVQMTLGEWLNVALTLESIDPNLKLVVPDCKATPTNDPNDPTFFNLFSQKCQKDPTLGFFPLNSTSFGFRYQTFKFVAFSNVVIQCDAFVCLVSEKNAECDRSCNSTSTGKRRKRDVDSREIYRVVSPPLNFIQHGDGVVIDRGDGWEVNLVTTKSPSTSSMVASKVPVWSTGTVKTSTKVSSVTLPTIEQTKSQKTSQMTTSKPIPSDSPSPPQKTTSKPIPSDSPSPPQKTTSKPTPPQKKTSKPISSDSPTPPQKTTSKPIPSDSPPQKTSQKTTSKPKPSVSPSEKTTIKKQNSSTISSTTPKPIFQHTVGMDTVSTPNELIKMTSSNSQTSSPENQKHIPDPNKLYVGGLNGKLTILSHASCRMFSFYTLLPFTLFALFVIL